MFKLLLLGILSFMMVGKVEDAQNLLNEFEEKYEQSSPKQDRPSKDYDFYDDEEESVDLTTAQKDEVKNFLAKELEINAEDIEVYSPATSSSKNEFKVSFGYELEKYSAKINTKTNRLTNKERLRAEIKEDATQSDEE